MCRLACGGHTTCRQPPLELHVQHQRPRQASAPPLALVLPPGSTSCPRMLSGLHTAMLTSLPDGELPATLMSSTSGLSKPPGRALLLLPASTSCPPSLGHHTAVLASLPQRYTALWPRTQRHCLACPPYPQLSLRYSSLIPWQRQGSRALGHQCLPANPMCSACCTSAALQKALLMERCAAQTQLCPWWTARPCPGGPSKAAWATRRCVTQVRSLFAATSVAQSKASTRWQG